MGPYRSFEEVLCNEVQVWRCCTQHRQGQGGPRLARGEEQKGRGHGQSGYTIAAGDVEEPLGGRWFSYAPVRYGVEGEVA
jgi:hypothetical protein